MGLILAGIICDRKRTYGVLFSVTALICPFIMFALTDEIGSSIVFWILGYILFVIATGLLFMLYNKIYANAAPVKKNEDDKLFGFINTYDISTREIDVLKLVLCGLPNSEIASNLHISENTVKFHVRNILKKTGCANRKEMVILYNEVK